MQKQRGPKWWILRLLALLMGGLLVLEYKAPLSQSGHQIVQAAILLLVYGLTVWWLRHNRGALVHEERERVEAVEHPQMSDTGDRAAHPGACSAGRRKGQASDKRSRRHTLRTARRGLRAGDRRPPSGGLDRLPSRGE